MPTTILEAIKEGVWDYEPDHAHVESFSGTDALPGTCEKLDVLAARLLEGKPLWHPADCLTYEQGKKP